MFNNLTTVRVQTLEDVKTFFDKVALKYNEQHGHSGKLLDYRLSLIKRAANFKPDDVVLEVGCGHGQHLIELAENFGIGIGIDLSAVMIELAKKRWKISGKTGDLIFRVDEAESLITVEDESIDVMLFVGTIEHLLNQSSVLINAFRVLKDGGRIICLTPNGNFIWYRYLAPVLGISTQHLSTDRFLNESEFRTILNDAKFIFINFSPWTFIPKGDMPPYLGFIMKWVDRLGNIFKINGFQSGLLAVARKN
ncbi:methyltransferase domain-containing protein [Caldithrix abyssi]|nr:methyltransferase domain-containing protein [Caldithrix abyssi]